LSIQIIGPASKKWYELHDPGAEEGLKKFYDDFLALFDER